jgi:hypothetical protein
VFVDVRLEQRPGQSAVALVGQLLRSGSAGTAVARWPVVLTSGRSVLMTTASNEHGEFHLEYQPAGQMRLHIPVEDGLSRIEIELNALMPNAGPRAAAPGSGRARSDRSAEKSEE